MLLLKDSLPGSVPFLLIIFLAGLVFLRIARTQKLGYLWLWGVWLLYFGFSIPAVSRILAEPLTRGFIPLPTSAAAQGAQAIIVLDGGSLRYGYSGNLLELPNNSSSLRAMEAARVYRLLGTPSPLVIVSGGDTSWKNEWAPEAATLRDTLIKLGVQPQNIILDSNSMNTREHAQNLTHLLRKRGIINFVLVTSPTHMRRSVAAFEAKGANPTPSPSPSLIDDKREWEDYWPSKISLQFTEETMHDYIGLAYYYFQGWI